MRNTFIKKSCRNWDWETSSRLLFVVSFKKLHIRSKQVVSILNLLLFGRPPLRHAIKNLQHFRLLIQRYDQFCFFIKGSGTSFPTTFCVRIFKNFFSMLHFFSWTNFTVWLSLFLEITDNMCTVIIWFPVCEVINFEINLSYESSRFFFSMLHFFS